MAETDKTTSLTAHMELWQILLHIVAVEGWNVIQINMKTAFLYEILPKGEMQYMEQPKRFKELGGGAME